MNEAKQRICEYKKVLPGLKEKVVAVSLLLVVSLTMVATVSFAWLSLSRSPEVTGVSTSIAANGNLEIALVPKDGSVPRESMVGDSNLSITERNLTWGNLVNLSDLSYGLNSLVLRPAMLNKYSLSANPLYGPIYDSDGRVIDLNTNFGFSEWNTQMSRFDYTKGFGVRAISSMTYGTSSASKQYNEKLNKINAMNMSVQNSYEALADRDDYMNALSSIIANHMAYKIKNSSSSIAGMLNKPTISSTNLGYLADMYADFMACMEAEADAFAAFLNFQKELSVASSSLANISGEISGADLLARADANANSKTVYNDLKSKGYNCAAEGFIQEIDQFILDYNTLKTDIEQVKTYQVSAQNNGGTLDWDQNLTELINHLVIIDNCLIVDGENSYKVSGIGGSIAMNLVGHTVDAYITNGIFKRFENRGGARLYAEKVRFSIGTSIGTQTIYGNIQTDATENYFENERANTAAYIEKTFGAPDYIANDTYGLALDMWVRTNAQGSYLTLQGNVLTETKQERATGKDANGNVVELWTITVTEENVEDTTDSSATEDSGGLDIQLSKTYDIYCKQEKDESGTDVTNWYYASNHTKVDSSLVYDADEKLLAKEKVVEVEYVVGYEGENRVWNGSEYADLSVNSSTQGSGSCYVFYADTPADQLRTLTLLKAMKVAFIDENGTLLASAYLDTEHYYAESGKVIVPLVLDPSTSTYITTDVNGNELYGITKLEKNVPLRITSILYLDGNGLGNEDVLASADIQGNLNIQFGSSNEMTSIDNEDLYNSVIEATASVSKNSFDFDTDTDLKTTVSVDINGTTPKTVKAFFIREINTTQGTREKTFELKDEDGDGTWTYDYTFDYPGTYIIRSVEIDGTEYELANPKTSLPRVTVEGFAIADVEYSLDEIVLSDQNSYTGEVKLKFVTDDPSKMPKDVQGSFVREDGTTATVDFVYNPTTQWWSGTVTIGSSGVYTMEYVTFDGHYVALSEKDCFTVDLKLGMSVEVNTTTYPLTFGTEDENAPEKLSMQVKIVDNNGEPVVGLANARLNYVNAGSASSTIETKLIWNQDLECYEGELQVKEGIWKFNHVTVAMGGSTNLATSTLTVVNSDAPVFTIVPPEPPAISQTQPKVDLYQFLNNANGVDDGARISINLDGATAATVVAKITKANGEVKYVLGTLKADLESSEGDLETVEFEFILPEGEWTLSEVYAWNVYGEKTEGDESAPFYPLPSENGNAVTSSVLLSRINNAETRDETLKTAYKVGSISSNNTVAALYNVTINLKYSTTTGQINNNVVTFGKGTSGDIIQSVFMDTHSINPGEIQIVFDDENDLIKSGNFSVSNVTLGIDYAAFNTKYGGYTSGNENTVQAQLGLFAISNNIATLNNALTLQYAAQYDMGTLGYSIFVNGETTTITVDGNEANGAHKYEVWSVKPTVVISDITLDGNGAYSVDLNTTGSLADSSTYEKKQSGCLRDYIYTCTTHKNHIYAKNNTQYISKIENSGRTAWLYFKCNHSDVSTYDGGRQNGSDWGATFEGHTYSYNGGEGVPRTTLNLSGMGNATSAVLEFSKSGGGDVVMITQYTADRNSDTYWGDISTYGTSSYEWTSDGQCMRFIGVMDNGAGENSSDTKTVAETITASSLVMTYDGEEYTFTIPTITINNPY